MAEPNRKRRQILVDSELQFGMSLHLIGWLYFYVIAFALLANAPAIFDFLSGSESDIGYAAAVERMRWFAQSTMLPLAMTFVCVAAHCMVFTHRVAGPAFRIRTVLSELAARRLPQRPVTLRDNDYFKDICTELNKVIDAQREDAARQRRMNAEISSGIRDLAAAIDEGRLGKDELLALAKAATESAERVDRHLAAVEPQAAPAAAPAAADATNVTPEPAEAAGR
jgi:methyl-accepting chemotaxis protein